MVSDDSLVVHRLLYLRAGQASVVSANLTPKTQSLDRYICNLDLSLKNVKIVIFTSKTAHITC